MKSKKALSEVIATVLIIMITVVAVTLIWAVIIPLVNNQIGGSKECTDAQGDLKIGSGGFTCIKSDGTISLQVSRGPADYVLSSIGVSVYVGGSAYPENITVGLPVPNQDRVFFITNHSRNKAYSDATRLEIFPVLKIGNVEKLCGKAQEVSLVSCIE